MALEDAVTVIESKESAGPSSSGALVKCGNELIMMRRDNNSNIDHPGMLGLLGGVIETGESANQALVRELEEEIGVKIDKTQIENLGHLDSGVNGDHTKNISLVDITPEQKAKIEKGDEGEGIEFFDKDNLPTRGFVPDLDIFFITHKDKLIKWLNGARIEAADLGLI